MDEDKQTNDNEQAEEQQSPESMDEVIEREAEAELDEERGDDGQADDTAESGTDSDDESDAEGKSEESAEETDESEDAEDEEVEESKEEEEQQEIDTSSFSEAGIDAVPDDYKPTNWKGFMQDVVEVIKGEVSKETRALNEQQQAYNEEVNRTNQSWDNEIAELQKAGELPKDEKELTEATRAVFEFMAENNQKYANNPNKQIWSFETAYKLKNAGSVSEERKAEIATRRKARAAAASAAGSSEEGSGLPSVNKGESMDDIIARELGI